MARSRSNSPLPARRRDRDRDRERDRDRRRRRSRERDIRRRSPAERSRHRDARDKSRSRDRSRSRSPMHKSQPTGRSSAHQRPAVSELELQGKTEAEKEMMKVMGFAGFDTTKGKKVDGNAHGDVHVILKRKYRQYMNRKGGFNRPLDFVA